MKKMKHMANNTKNRADKRKNRKVLWYILLVGILILILAIELWTTPNVNSGVVWSGLEYRCNHGLTLQKLTDIKNQWNIKFLRYTFNEEDYTNDSQIWDGSKWVSYRQTMRNVTNWSKSLGITTILVLDWLSMKEKYPPIPDSGSITMWGKLAQEPTYKNDPLVWFDIYGEVHDATIDQWRPMADKIVTEIRKYSNNTVMVSGLDYSWDLSPWREKYLTQPNVIYDSHPYGPSTKGSGAYDLDNKIGGVLSDGKVVFLGEFGANWNFTTDGGKTYPDRDFLINYALPWFDGIGRGTGIPTTPIGWTAWSMTDNPLLIDDKPGCFNSTITPSDYGQVIQNKLNNKYIVFDVIK